MKPLPIIGILLLLVGLLCFVVPAVPCVCDDQCVGGAVAKRATAKTPEERKAILKAVEDADVVRVNPAEVLGQVRRVGEASSIAIWA